MAWPHRDSVRPEDPVDLEKRKGIAIPWTRMADDYTIVRDRIVSSLFCKTNENGLLEDTYVGHIKVWEDVPPQTTQYSEDVGMKPRYLMASST